MVSMVVLIRIFKECTYRAPIRYITKTWSVVLLNKKIHILLPQVYCVWQVVKTPTIISNNPVFWSSILLLTPHDRFWVVPVLHSESDVFPSKCPVSFSFRIDTVYIFPPCTLVICVEEYKSCLSSSSYLHHPVSFTLLGPNVPTSTLVSNTLSLWSFLNTRDQVL
jgi:hypothetical protein